MSVHFSSKTDNWATPQDFFDSVNDEFSLLWDVCASSENAKLPLYWTKEQDGLTAEWRGKRVWMTALRFTDRQMGGEGCDRRAEVCVCLLPARTDTRWFHRHIYANPKAEIRFVKGRLKFGGAANSAPFPSMLVIFRSDDTDGSVL